MRKKTETDDQCPHRPHLLIDGDIFKPGDLARNELGAESLGAHKVDALEDRLRAVAPNVTVGVWRVDLGGQESSGRTVTIIDMLAGYNLLIDATTRRSVPKDRRAGVWKFQTTHPDPLRNVRHVAPQNCIVRKVGRWREVVMQTGASASAGPARGER